MARFATRGGPYIEVVGADRRSHRWHRIRDCSKPPSARCDPHPRFSQSGPSKRPRRARPPPNGGLARSGGLSSFIPIFLAQAALGALGTGGVIVNISGVIAEQNLPGMAAYGASKAADHQRRISWAVGPLMAAEGVTALVLLVDRPDTMAIWTSWAAAALLGVALASTVLVQVPLHARLAERHDDHDATRLIITNWVRTVAWSMRGLLLAWVLAT